MKSKKIMFTGGGSAGHVTLNLSLIPEFQKNGWTTSYIGTNKGIEKELVASIKNVQYFSIKAGKLRRYISLKNIIDLIKTPIGIIQSYKIIKKENPDIIFSKGGFVSFPVVFSAWLNNKKVYLHESDLTPGLANKISMPFISKIFTTFEETAKYIKQKNKIEHVGPIISDRLFGGSHENALKLCGFTKNKPIVLVIGGSLGAKSINNAIRDNIKKLTKAYQIIHICGKDQIDKNIKHKEYAQFEYVDKELKDFMAAASVVISRAGSNSIFELLSLHKPMILIPLPQTSSRGEQALNAQAFVKKGFSEVIHDEGLIDNKLLTSTLDKVFANKEYYINNMQKNKLKTTNYKILYKMIIN